MPSRKRAKGKARKLNAGNGILILHDKSRCSHGCGQAISKDDICYKFIERFEVEMNAMYEAPANDRMGLLDCYRDIMSRLLVFDEFNMIRDNSETYQRKLLPLFICLGTNILLRTDNHYRSGQLATIVAAAALFSVHRFDLREVMRSYKSRLLMRDLQDGNHFDAIKFFNRRTPCQCINNLYLKEKSKQRIGKCQSCQVEKERKYLFICSGCMYHHYCGVQCQSNNWLNHKASVCNWISDLKHQSA